MKLPGKIESSLRSAMDQVPDATGYLIAYSGGLDSTVLLHLSVLILLRERKKSVRAIHVNHGLSDNAGIWEDHCRRQVEKLGVPILVRRGNVIASGKGIEAAARKLRYAAFEQVLAPGEALLQAHHLNDQVETFFYRAIKGKAVGGLAGIPQTRDMVLADGEAVLFRPLLGVTRSSLEMYAESRCLSWIDDESNASLNFDRNYLRHEIIPRLQDRWPNLLSGVASSMAHCTRSEQILMEVAAQDLQSCRLSNSHPVMAWLGWDNTALRVSDVAGKSSARRDNLLRYWLREAGAPFCGMEAFYQLVEQVLPSRSDAKARVAWCTVDSGEWEIRKHDDGLYLGPALAIEREISLALGESRMWQGKKLGVQFPVSKNESQSSWQFVLPKLPGVERLLLTIRPVQPGDKLKLPMRPRKKVMQWMKESGIPYWLRPHVPGCYYKGELVAVPFVGVDEAFLPTDSSNPLEGGLYELIWGNSL